MNEREEYFELLRFPSVSADRAHFKDCLDCAAWWRRWLSKIGFSVELLYPENVADPNAMPQPVVFAERKVDEGRPTVLIYGHYDVQPANPPTDWVSPPFEPTERDGRIYCRGAEDDKGQSFALMCGLRDVLDKAPNVKIVLEGQEESGSTALMAMAPKMRRQLAADVLLVCDTSAAAELRPAIIAGLRGVSHFTCTLTAVNRDLHSGEYGGVAPNVAQGIAELVASLHAPDGSIAVEGFMDGIEPPSAEELAAAEESTPSFEALKQDIGCEPRGGERELPLVQRLSFKPTIEINGIHSGYGGPGSKTVIPCSAVAKISMRLVPGQTPQRALDTIKAHLEARVPAGMTLEISEVNAGAGGFRLPLNSPIFRLASEVLQEMDERGPVFLWDGASIPVVSVIREVSGAAPLMVGWGQAEDRIHSPNESYSWTQFDKARDWARRILCAI